MTTRAQRTARRGALREGGSNAGGGGAAVAAAAAPVAAPAAPAPTFNDLPDELALRIFACLDLHARCARWERNRLSMCCPTV